ncbi:uncharacterized protein LOC120253587 [Dioscorea cayenensis subsp. rotundata]|uniref:Uncharacterized protein LOC120253587 n=1 Tax=Dioscorea cayennensis subsp. rotundata TaxID=55577 RepID=A0AB40ASR1_DIOCR|nr:uncharacterized protein LOC120253587 [Dioscorea cayenensis subsp. rotundata]
MSAKRTSGSGVSTTEHTNRKDPAWKYGVQVEVPGEGKSYVYIQCKFCNKVIKGGVKRMKDHLGGTHKNVVPCDKVPPDVKQEINDYVKKKQAMKHKTQEEFDLSVDVSSYFGTRPSFEGMDSCPSEHNHTRGVRGPMDRFVTNVDGEDEVDTGTQPTITPTATNSKEARNLVCLDIGRFFFENGIAFNVIKSPSFANMVMSIGNYGRGLKRPSIHELRNWILNEEIKTTNKIVEEMKRTWPSTGVSIMSDEWKDTRGRSLINFLVNNPEGTVFLKSVDVSNKVKDGTFLFKLLDDVVEEIGEENVVQVITDNASAYKYACNLLMEKRKQLYWTPCAAHCLDLMLEKLGELPQHKHALMKAKKVMNFIYNHGWVLALMRKFTQRELIRPTATRFATAYLTLQSLLQSKQ